MKFQHSFFFPFLCIVLSIVGHVTSLPFHSCYIPSLQGHSLVMTISGQVTLLRFYSLVASIPYVTLWSGHCLVMFTIFSRHPLIRAFSCQSIIFLATPLLCQSMVRSFICHITHGLCHSLYLSLFCHVTLWILGFSWSLFRNVTLPIHTRFSSPKGKYWFL